MQTCTEQGLSAAMAGERRWSLQCLHLAKVKYQGAQLEEMWKNASAIQAHQVLSSPDVVVTNQKDKERLLPKVLEMDSHVSKMFSTPVATTVT